MKRLGLRRPYELIRYRIADIEAKWNVAEAAN